MHWNRGRLPWQGINAMDKKEKQEKIGHRKAITSHAELCEGFPNEFVQFLRHCDHLPYENAPDYEHLRQIMLHVLLREQAPHDLQFDWMLPDWKPRAQVVKDKTEKHEKNDKNVENLFDDDRSRSTKRRKLDRGWD